MDNDIVQGPIKLLEKLEKKGRTIPGSKPGQESGGMTPEETESLNTLLPALSGSCALLAFLDAGRNK